jgi:geranylgeranyl transferase type-2 subunit beta
VLSYLTQLTLRLAAGAARFPEELRRRHAAFLAKAQNPDGGFSGREGPSDLYYTGFALRGLALTAELSDPIAEAASRFLEQRLAAPLASIDFLSLVFSAVLLEAVSGVDLFGRARLDRREAVAARLRTLGRADGGYAKGERDPQSSTYHTFLGVSCKQLVGLPLDEAQQVIAFVQTRRREDGGFVELRPLRRSGTNPTAAAAGLLRLLGALDRPTRSAAARFLAGMQGMEGGLRAHAGIPIADLLSTFTGLVALADLEEEPCGPDVPPARNSAGVPPAGDAAETAAPQRVVREAALRYVRALEQPGGGFTGGAWDKIADVEYTFYGLGVMALLG